MKFCSECGQPISFRIPDGDDRPRHVCSHCGVIHYQNPRIIVGCIATHGERVLLCRRAIEPRLGYWTLPSGFMENGETTLQGAQRETWEEARGRVDDRGLYRLFDLPHINQVYLFYRGVLVDGEHAVGPESSATRLCSEAEVPWDQLAFPVMLDTLRDFFADMKRGEFPLRVCGVQPHWASFWGEVPLLPDREGLPDSEGMPDREG